MALASTVTPTSGGDAADSDVESSAPSIEVEQPSSTSDNSRSNRPFAATNWKRGFKSSSTSQLQTLVNGAARTPSPHPLANKISPSNLQSNLPDLNTIPDPRSPSPRSVDSSSSANGGHHPDLSNEVAALSTKLINSINHQTYLDDQLQGAKAELDEARARIAELEEAQRKHQTMMMEGLLVSKDDAERAEAGLKNEILSERQAKSAAERDKRSLEQELENLTSNLFEEANSMVATARKEHEESQKINEQLKTKLLDTEALLASHQDQLRDLKFVLQQIQSEREFDGGQASTGPSTPVTMTHERMSRSIDYTHHSRQTSNTVPQQPQHPLQHTHLITPVLRNDLPAYEEFLTLFKTPGKPSGSRTPSGSNFVGLNIIGTSTSNAQSQSTVSSSSSSQHTPNNSAGATSQSSPNMPGSFGQISPTFTNAPEPSTPLKENKFYKRTLTEDIEPTLRLDAAPSLSWLSRRNIISSLHSGALIVEPFTPSRLYNYSHLYICSLCGESRSVEPYIRKHRFRTSDSEDAQRYPLCDACLARVRAAGDFVTFLRMVKQGHWSRDDVQAAWDECARLRERMFWARLAGGVVPTSTVHHTNTTASGTPLLHADAVPGSPLKAALAGSMKKKSESNATNNIPDVGSLTEERDEDESVNEPQVDAELKPDDTGAQDQSHDTPPTEAGATSSADTQDTPQTSSSSDAAVVPSSDNANAVSANALAPPPAHDQDRRPSVEALRRNIEASMDAMNAANEKARKALTGGLVGKGP